MEETRTKIWDLLYRADGPKSIVEIASQIDRDVETVRAATNHDWFQVIEDRVAIAYATR